jgi:hypothetical protein
MITGADTDELTPSSSVLDDPLITFLSFVDRFLSHEHGGKVVNVAVKVNNQV